MSSSVKVDVLCVGHACYDLLFSVDEHPKSDEKVFAHDLTSSGGGPAANAAIAVSRLGFSAAFAGYLGQDIYGQMHQQEFVEHHVDTDLVVRGASPTPLSTVIVKPNGERALINYKGATKPLSSHAIDFSKIQAHVILFDGHEPHVSLALLELAKANNIPTVLDAGSMHEGTAALWNKVDYVVASEKFALQFADDVPSALTRMAKESPAVVITLGERGLVWQRGNQSGRLKGLSVNAIDTTGAGDAFHGAFAAALSATMEWHAILNYASAAGALCCTKIGARHGLPWKEEHLAYLTKDR
jgi:sulfofructose kinase